MKQTILDFTKQAVAVCEADVSSLKQAVAVAQRCLPYTRKRQSLVLPGDTSI